MGEITGVITGLGVLLLFTCFVKFIATLSILRFGLGLEGVSFGIVTVALSLALSILVMQPQLKEIGGLTALSSEQVLANGVKLEKAFEPFLRKHSDPLIQRRFESLSRRISKAAPGTPAAEVVQPGSGSSEFMSLAAAFLVSELREAFKLGFLFILPFLVIDLIVVNLLMCLGIQQLPPAVVALPVKVLLFVAVDGWTLVSEKLLGGYI